MRRTTLTSTIMLALNTVRDHKMRSFLTVLGVIIGSGAIIAVGSIVAGLNGMITSLIEGLGTNTAMIFKYPIAFHTPTPEERERKPLTWENAVSLRERCPAVERVSAFLLPPSVFARAPGQGDVARYKGNELFNAILRGTDESYAGSGQVDMQEGRFYTDTESRHHVPVTVIGADVPKALMSGEDPIGKEITIDGQAVEIIGLMKRPANFPPGANDTRILLPYFTMQKMFPMARENMIVILAQPGKLPAAIDEARVALRVERHVPPDKPDNFDISTSDQMLETFHNITAMVAIVMIGLSSIGLLVGGIGVMNIMLVSVTERTREIGVRKAIGARRSDIVLQFLTEAVVLTGLGGLLGMTLGWLVSLLCRLVFPSLPTAVPVWAAILGVCVSVGVGLFFGIWPANKAARLDPVVALRYE